MNMANRDCSRLSPEETERYSRHLRLPGFEESTQLRLKNSAVLVVGVGGLGCPAATYLAAAGVGTIGIADFDRVERHNLQRQILFNEKDVGKPKAEVAKARLEALHTGLEVILHAEGIQQCNALEILKDYDVILDGTDNFGTRYLLNDATFLLGKPLVSGSVFRMEGQVIVLNSSPQAACYRCLFPEPPAPGTVPDCNEAGVIGALCGMIGSLQAMETIKLITGIGRPLEGKWLKFDLEGNRFAPIAVQREASCPLCGEQSRIRDLNSEQYVIPCEVLPMKTMDDQSLPELGMEIDAQTARQLFATANALPLDIRETDEAEICQIKGSLFIPMGLVPERLVSVPKDRPVVVYCHHGFRSMRVVQYLKSMGYANCTSLRGGIHQWANVCEPTMKRY